jgi:hypothetical protein
MVEDGVGGPTGGTDGGSERGSSRRDLLRKAAVTGAAGVAVWAAPAIVSIDAAGATSGPVSPTPGCASLSPVGCGPAALQSIYTCTNNCNVPILLSNGPLVAPGETRPFLVGPIGLTLQVFPADAQGNAIGPAFQTQFLPTLCQIPPGLPGQ